MTEKELTMENKRYLYYLDRNNNFYTKYTKEEIRNMINPFKPSTFIHFLKDMDYPYLEKEWSYKLAYICSNKVDSLKNVIGKYIATMRLPGYKDLHFKDSQYHKDLNEFRLSCYGVHLDQDNCMNYIIDLTKQDNLRYCSNCKWGLYDEYWKDYSCTKGVSCKDWSGWEPYNE